MGYPLQYSWASLVAQLIKNPPAMRETWVQSLGWEDPLEKGKATHSSILAWRIQWTTVYGVTKIRLNNFHFHKRSQIVKGILRKKNKAGAITLPDFRLSYKANSQKVQYWDKSRHIHKLNRRENPQVNQCIHG